MSHRAPATMANFRPIFRAVQEQNVVPQLCCAQHFVQRKNGRLQRSTYSVVPQRQWRISVQFFALSKNKMLDASNI